MDIQSLLSDSLIQTLGEKLGTDQTQTSKALQMAVPALMGALNRNSNTEEGASSLLNALKSDTHNGQALNNINDLISKVSQGEQSGILNHILGNNRAVVENAISQNSGLDAQSTSKIFETVAPLLMGVLGKQQREQGLDANGISGLLTNLNNQAKEADTSGGMTLIEKLLDRDGDGNIADDIAGIGMKLLGGFMKGK